MAFKKLGTHPEVEKVKQESRVFLFVCLFPFFVSTV